MKFTQHKDYVKALPELIKCRDCIEGEPAVKRKRTIYLKHPNSTDQTSTQSQARYEKLIEGAEFDGFPAETLNSMVGQMGAGEINHDFPQRIEYLWNNSDGDGMSLAGAIENTEKNVATYKLHFLLSDYQGITSLDSKTVTVADVKKAKPQSVIKHYTRESLIDWEFDKVNGVSQITLAVFCEESTARNPVDLTTETVKSFLVLRLDDEGYSQQKYIESEGGDAESRSEKLYIKSPDGAALNYIPLTIVSDDELQSGSLPSGMGYIYPICSASLYRYVMSADYKEAMRFLFPTGFSDGWKSGDKDIFKECNEGRESLAFGIGVCNNMPEGVGFKFEGANGNVDHYVDYFRANEDKTRALGGKIDMGSDTQMTATQANINNSKNIGAMSKIVSNTEAGFRRAIASCGVLEGLWTADDRMDALDEIALDLPTEFGVTLSPEQRAVIVAEYSAGIISRAEAVRQLVQGGVTVGDAEQIENELDNEPVLV